MYLIGHYNHSDFMASIFNERNTFFSLFDVLPLAFLC